MNIIKCLSQWFLIVVLLSASAVAFASMPVKSVAKHHGANEFLPFVAPSGENRSEQVVRHILESKLNSDLEAERFLSTFEKSSKVELPSGGELYKYSHYIEGRRVIGDWVTVKLANGGWVENLKYRFSKPALDKDKSLIRAQEEKKLSASKTNWSLSEQDLANVAKGMGLAMLANKSKQVWFQLDNNLVPAISFDAAAVIEGRPTIYKIVLHANSAELLEKADISAHLGDYKYRIYADSTPLQPYQNPFGYTFPTSSSEPGDPAPDTFVDQQDFTISELSNIVDDHWLPDNASELLGNNVDVFFNFTRSTDGTFDFFGDGYGPQYRVRGDEFDLDFRAPVNNGNEFLYTYDPTDLSLGYVQPVHSDRNPTASETILINAQQVNAFYLANLMHDLFYDAGFTEAAGNAQSSNFGRGGIENDPLIIHINSFTFVRTPQDGESPVIHLGMSLTGGSTAFDTGVFVHEWTHYLFRRLVNPNLDVTNNQSRALNEGWADVIGVLMGMKAQDFATAQSVGFTGLHALGDYFQLTPRPPDQLNPFFYGIRRYPYGDVNPFTFEHIAHKATLPTGFSYSNYVGRGSQNSQIHTAGEIWANTVLACFRGVIANSGTNDFFDIRQTIAKIIVASMANTPSDPTFLEARDALLGVLKTNFNDHYQQCKMRFAERGMGSGAVSPPRESKDFTERVASFSLQNFNVSIVSANLLEIAGGLDNDGILDSAENGTIELRLRNTGFEPIIEADVELLEDNSSYSPGSRRKVTIQDLPIGADVIVELPLRLTHTRDFDLTNFVVRVATPNGENRELTTAFRTHYDHSFAAPSDFLDGDFDIVFQDWQLDRIIEQRFVDSNWEPIFLGNNEVWQLSEPILQQENIMARALVSPWLIRSNGALKFDFMHAFEFSGSVHIEFSTDDLEWLPFDQLMPSFETRSPNYPLFSEVSLVNTSLSAGQRFKIRIRVNGLPPITWRLDKLNLTGVSESPFKIVLPEDGVDLNTFCFPIKSKLGLAVACL